MPHPLAHLRSRAPLLASAAVAAALLTLAQGPAPEATPRGVATLLGDATERVVADDAFVWEASRGALRDALRGRDVLFLGATPGGLRDVFRARVRVHPSGRPLSVRGVTQLTHTPLADEEGLVARGAHAAFATRWQGRVVRVGLLALDTPAAPSGVLARLAELFGEPPLPSLVDVGLAQPPEAFAMELREDALVLALGEDKRAAALFLGDLRLEPGRLGDSLYLAAHGPEDGAPGWLDGARARLPFLAAPRGPTARPAPRPPLPSSGASDAAFPPAALAPPLAEPWPGEGQWGALGEPLAEGAPPPLVGTFVRVDAADPESVVSLACLDTRQLVVGYEGGRDARGSATGVVGRPRARAAEAPLATWNGGGVRAERGAVAGGLPLSPLLAGAPTVRLDERGDAWLGPHSAEISSPPKAAWQSGATLVQAGQSVPSDDSARVPRSALGRTAAAQLLYAVSARSSREALSRALVLAGATFAVELAAGDVSQGLSSLPRSPESPPAELDAALAWAGRGATRESEGDFFFAAARDPLAALPPWDGPPFERSAGQQPAPSWLTGVFEAQAERLGTRLTVWLFAARRFELVLRAGTREPRRKEASGLAEALPEALLPRALARLGMGIGPRRGGPALVVEGVATKPPRRDEAALLLSREGALSLATGATWEVPEGGSAAEVPLLAEGGQLRREARAIGRRRSRVALCQLPDGALLVASARFDSDEVTATALLGLGCSWVVGLERGAERDARAARGGGEAALPASAEDSALWILGKESASGRAEGP